MSKFTAYSTRELQAAISVVTTTGGGQHILSVINQEIAQRLSKTKVAVTTPVCPDCGGRLLRNPVNVSRCTRVGGGYKIVDTCPACGYEHFS